MSDVLIGKGAEEDYAESLRWYAERGKQAAEGFEAAFAQALGAIAANPGCYPLRDDHHRFYLIEAIPIPGHLPQGTQRRIADCCRRAYEPAPRLMVGALWLAASNRHGRTTHFVNSYTLL